MAAMGDTVTGATDPFDRNPVGRPTTNTSAWSDPPTAPIGSVSSGPTTVTWWPRLRRARDSPSTWPCTPPGRDSE